MNSQSGITTPQMPAPASVSTTIDAALTSMTAVETARIQAGPTYLVIRDADCTPMMMPIELTANSTPYCCASNA
jgi:hypothetical protein